MKHTSQIVFVNFLSLVRFAFAGLFVWLASNDLWIIIWLLSPVAFGTDWLDGKLARKWNATSSFGKFIDPLSDKAVSLTLLWLIAIYYGLSWVYVAPVIIISLYDISMVILRLINQKSSGKMVGASSIAKKKTAALMGALGVMVSGVVLENIELLGDVLRIGGVALLLYSTYLVALSFKNYMKVFNK